MMWLAIAIVATPSFGQTPGDVYKYSQPEEDLVPVPDVNKSPTTPVPDNSCWLATAANLLAGAGWGTAANTPQQNADAIYAHLTAHFGTVSPGYCERAVNWWLLNYGYNPSAPDLDFYNPALSYSDVTHVAKHLWDVEYDTLLDELVRCQYIAVDFEIPGASVGHCMTLVGGNYSNLHVPAGVPQQSVFHDSDDALSGDAVYTNTWVVDLANPPLSNWTLDVAGTPGLPGDDWQANGYTKLCPGLQKPQAAVENFDYARFRDLDTESGTWFTAERYAGVKNYQTWWADEGEGDEWILAIENEEMPSPWYKEVWLLVDYLVDAPVDPDIVLRLALDGEDILPTSTTYSEGFGQILFYWRLDSQPAVEYLVFPDQEYRDLWQNVIGVKDWNLATLCTPEPATLTLLGSGLAALWLRRRRR